MEVSKSIELFKEVREQVKGLSYDDIKSVTNIRDRLIMLIKRSFDEKSYYIPRLQKILFVPLVASYGTSDNLYRDSFKNGKQSLLSLLDTMLEDLQLSSYEAKEDLNNLAGKHKSLSDSIFIVHGHNEEMKQSVARMLEKLDLKTIILHEQANKGRTIIEKFSDHSDVSFAIVLLSADDVGFSVKEKPIDGKFRARQNVILELGFFLGKLGRQNVVALFEVNDNFEFPSDYQGVIFIPYDQSGSWKFEIIKELKAASYKVDANKII